MPRLQARGLSPPRKSPRISELHPPFRCRGARDRRAWPEQFPGTSLQWLFYTSSGPAVGERTQRARPLPVPRALKLLTSSLHPWALPCPSPLGVPTYSSGTSRAWAQGSSRTRRGDRAWEGGRSWERAAVSGMREPPDPWARGGTRRERSVGRSWTQNWEALGGRGGIYPSW